jgi:hypothetical protein
LDLLSSALVEDGSEVDLSDPNWQSARGLLMSISGDWGSKFRGGNPIDEAKRGEYGK